MKNHYTIGEFRDIKLNLHSTFLLLVIAIGVYALLFTPENFWPFMFLIVALFGSVLLHELSHAVVAQSKGYHVESITLLPIGGITNADTAVMSPKNEFKVAIAGPLFNLVVCVVLVAVHALNIAVVFPSITDGLTLLDIGTQPLAILFYINFSLALFNLLVPALPMDGGRILRSFLAMKMDYLKATGIASGIAGFLSFAMFLWGVLIGNPLLPLIAIFVYFGSKSEFEFARVQHFLRGVSLSEVVDKRPLMLKPDTPLMKAVEKMNARAQTSALLKELSPCKVAQIEAVVQGIQLKNAETVSDVANKVTPLHLKQSAADAYKSFLTSTIDVLPVLSEGKLVGAVYRQTLDQVYRLRIAEKTLKLPKKTKKVRKTQ